MMFRAQREEENEHGGIVTDEGEPSLGARIMTITNAVGPAATCQIVKQATTTALLIKAARKNRDTALRSELIQTDKPL